MDKEILEKKLINLFCIKDTAREVFVEIKDKSKIEILLINPKYNIVVKTIRH